MWLPNGCYKLVFMYQVQCTSVSSRTNVNVLPRAVGGASLYLYAYVLSTCSYVQTLELTVMQSCKPHFLMLTLEIKCAYDSHLINCHVDCIIIKGFLYEYIIYISQKTDNSKKSFYSAFIKHFFGKLEYWRTIS